MQKSEEELVRMPALQEQDKDIANPHPLCGQAPLPGADVDEHCH